MEYKKVNVISVETRRFIQDILYLGSLGGQLTRNCAAIKGIMLRAEIELPWDVPVEESPTIKVSKQPKIVKEEEIEEKKPVPKKGRPKQTPQNKPEETAPEAPQKEEAEEE